MADTSVTTPPSRQATNLEGFVIGGVGAVAAWVVLGVGVGIGYGLAAVIASWSGQPLQPLSWAQVAARGPLGVAAMFGMAGFLIEVLRFQGPPRGGRFFKAWSAAGPLRCRLLLVLSAAAIGIGLFAGLWWEA